MGMGAGGGEEGGGGGGQQEEPSGGGEADMMAMMMADPSLREELAKAMQGKQQQTLDAVPSGQLAGHRKSNFGPNVEALPVFFGGGG